MKPNIDGLAKESHLRAADAGYASAALVEMQKNPSLEAPGELIECGSSTLQMNF